MNIQIHQEYLEGDDPEQDIEELNRTASKPMYKSAALNAQTSFSKSKTHDIESSYEHIIKKYKDHFNPKDSENYNEDYDQKFIKKTTEENPLSTFEKLQSEVELIENDLKYYSENKDSYKSVAPIETSLEELNKLKYIIQYINTSKNYEKLKKIKEAQDKNGMKMSEDNYNLLNKKIYNNLDEKLVEKLNQIKKLKTENPINYQNLEYELFLIPDNEKMNHFKELEELVLRINEIEKKIGKWNFNNKKNTIASVLDSIKMNMLLLDKMAKVEMKKKFDAAHAKIQDIKNNYLDTYNTISQEKLKDLTVDGISAKAAEKIICNVIYKMELLKDDHEKSIYLSQKVKELINKNEEIKKQSEDNSKMLDSLQQSVKLNVETMRKNIEIIKSKL